VTLRARYPTAAAAQASGLKQSLLQRLYRNFDRQFERVRSAYTMALSAVLERRAEAELDPQVRRGWLIEAARLHERRGALPAAVAALQRLRAADEEDLEALTELGRLHEALGQAPELGVVLAERARLTDDPRQRAALWSRVGELRLGLLNDLDGAADAYREALDGAPDDALALSALEAIEDRRQDWSTLQEVLLRRLSAVAGPDQVAVLLKLARNAEQKLSDIDQAVAGLRRQQEMIDAQAVVFLPRAGLVVPEGIETGRVAGGTQRVGKAQIDERAEFLPGLRQEKRVLGPGFRPAGIGGGRDNIVIARQDKRFFQFQPFM